MKRCFEMVNRVTSFDGFGGQSIQMPEKLEISAAI